MRAEGLSAHEISERLETPIRTVYSWLARTDVQDKIATYTAAAEKTRARVYERHLETTRRQFEDWMAGKLELSDEARQRAMLEYGQHLLALGGVAIMERRPAVDGEPQALQAGASPALMPPGGTMVVQVYAGEQPKRDDAIETTGRVVE